MFYNNTVSANKDVITFLGTGGARFTVAKQLLASGGAWLNLHGKQILVDPGPGSLVYAIKNSCDPTQLDAILLSHKHLDHSSDINVMIEAMTEGGFKKRGSVFAPSDAFNNGAVILPYLYKCPKAVEILAEGREYALDHISFSTPVRHIHQVETYGFVIRTPLRTISWITDTRHFKELSEYYKADVVIMNVLSINGGPMDHLSLDDARRIICEIKPAAAIMTHFGMTMWKNNPVKIAEQLTEEIGIRVIAACDGMVLDLSELHGM